MRNEQTSATEADVSVASVLHRRLLDSYAIQGRNILTSYYACIT